MQTQQLSLSTARWIALAIYFSGLVVYPLVGAVVKAPVALPPEARRALPVAFLVGAVICYVISLVVEGVMLAQAKKANRPSSAANAVIVSAGFGEVPAVFGLLLTLLGMASWGVVLYSLCFIHGAHLAMRWPNFERVASGEGV